MFSVGRQVISISLDTAGLTVIGVFVVAIFVVATLVVVVVEDGIFVVSTSSLEIGFERHLGTLQAS